jgi:hypothetical protein
MPKQVLKYNIFLASPNDLEEERQTVAEIVKELNLTFANKNNIVLELITWETHSAPGVSQVHPQEIINKDIGADYDIFLGLLWKRFGSKTKNANSGTEEEFQIAYEKFKTQPTKFQILFYFKISPPKSLNEINSEDYRKVELFKKNISEKNVLYWEFDTIENFKNLLRIHIPKRLESLKEQESKEINRQITTSKEEDNFETEELGLLDLVEIFEISVATSLNSLEKITEATEWIGTQLNQKTEEITRISKIPNPNPNVIREILRRTASLMNDYSSRIKLETPIFYENFEEAIKAGSEMVNLAGDFYNETTISQLEETNESIFELKKGINEAIEGMTGFYNSVKDLPRIQKEINHAKKTLLHILEDLLGSITQSLQLAEEYKIILVNKIDKLKIENK